MTPYEKVLTQLLVPQQSYPYDTLNQIQNFRLRKREALVSVKYLRYQCQYQENKTDLMFLHLQGTFLKHSSLMLALFF